LLVIVYKQFGWGTYPNIFSGVGMVNKFKISLPFSSFGRNADLGLLSCKNKLEEDAPAIVWSGKNPNPKSLTNEKLLY